MASNGSSPEPDIPEPDIPGEGGLHPEPEEEEGGLQVESEDDSLPSIDSTVIMGPSSSSESPPILPATPPSSPSSSPSSSPPPDELTNG